MKEDNQYFTMFDKQNKKFKDICQGGVLIQIDALLLVNWNQHKPDIVHTIFADTDFWHDTYTSILVLIGLWP